MTHLDQVSPTQTLPILPLVWIHFIFLKNSKHLHHYQLSESIFQTRDTKEKL